MRNSKAYLNCLERQQAQDLWRNKLKEVGFFSHTSTEIIPVASALGRVTAATIYAEQSVPHYNGAAMDGIAVLAQDTFGAQETKPVRLSLLAPEEPFQNGCCYIVDTGDALPAGTNAVVMVEDIHVVEGQVEILAAVSPWQHVRIIGEDMAACEMVLPEHHVITAVDIAVLLAAGWQDIEVVKKPKVAVIPTGDEIVGTCQELQPGKILDVNSHMLGAAIAEWGGEPTKLPIVKDDRQAITRTIFASLQVYDVVIVNAGTSAGREDFTADVLADLGEVFVHGVAIKPGKPVVLAVCQGKPVVGLPGYPVSAMLTAELFIKDMIYARQRLPADDQPQMQATLAKQIASQIGIEEYVRVSVGNVKGQIVAAPLQRGAGLLSTMTKAQGVVRIDETCAGLSAGMTVPVTLIHNKHPEETILAVGSHDLALELMGVFLRRNSHHFTLACANVGSMGGIMAIRNGEAHIAGIHLLDEKTGSYNISFVKQYLTNEYQLVHFAMREQGLIVQPGNPKQITGLEDLGRADINFINRQRGSGTRMLLDYQISKRGIARQEVKGYDKEVGTHMAVAASIAAGTADVGLGVYAAAKALGLEFIPVAQEQYDILLNFDRDDERLHVILNILTSKQFRSEVEAWGGYDLREAGKVLC